MGKLIQNMLEKKFWLQHKELSKSKVMAYYDFLLESQFYSREKLVELQLDYFSKLWSFSIKHIPFYKDMAKRLNLSANSIQTFDDLKKISILTKDIVRTNFDALQSDVDRKRFIYNSTSGTSGNNFFFYSDRQADNWQCALNFRRYGIMGCSPFDTECCIWGAAFDLPKYNFKQQLKRFFQLENQIAINGYHLSDSDILDIYRRINGRNVIMKSYPSILEKVATVLEQNSLSIDVKAIHIAGEKLYPYQTEIIKRVFGKVPFDFYGARDCPNMGEDCSEHMGVHVYMENVIFEVIDENENPIEEGEGDIVITGLHNYVMPLIRYKIGDRAKVSKGKICKCGRNLQVVDEILGRSFDIIRFPNGNSVEGTFWTLLMKSKPGIREFQIIQEEEDYIRIIYKKDGSVDSIPIDYFKSTLNQYAGDSCRFDFEEISEIKPTSAGKMKFVISKVKK